MSLQKQIGNRLKKELTALQKSPPYGIQVNLPTDDLYAWEAEIQGPEQSHYKGGIFKVRINIPEKYPMEPPSVHFVTPIYHLNVSQSTGQVCLAFLAADKWVATGTIEQLLNALYSLLIRPEEENAFDHEVLNKYHHYDWEYKQLAQQSASKAK
ncbi:ubiquitin-conjugating enzyme E2 D4-like [Ptychodera flava]|uniref:ubiquitin-conjugating enzyme E2 D4-like n=1 Tax=Ptychodera flava TaxID=63121 RepID=UPI00396A0ADC